MKKVVVKQEDMMAGIFNINENDHNPLFLNMNNRALFLNFLAWFLLNKQWRNNAGRYT
jgi:hypothetical protein